MEPFFVKSGPIRKPMITKAYVTVFVCFATKAVHLEVASVLMTAAFIASLCRFIARRGKTSVVWSDGTNFVGANRELQDRALRQFAQTRLAKYHHRLLYNLLSTVEVYS